MTTITDEYIKGMLPSAKRYCVAILKKGSVINHPDKQKLQWEHVRRNFQLRADGIMPIVLPVMDETDTMGIGIFNTDNIEEVKKNLDEDPNIKAGIFIYEVHPCFSFPGDSLPV